jgi:hypothetical protein
LVEEEIAYRKQQTQKTIPPYILQVQPCHARRVVRLEAEWTWPLFVRGLEDPLKEEGLVWKWCEAFEDPSSSLWVSFSL